MEAKVVPVDDAATAAAASGADGAGPQKPNPRRRRRKGLFFCCKHAAVPHLGKIRAGVLKAVSYAKFKLTPEELLMVWEAAEHSPSLERLDLTGNDLEPVFFDAVSVLQRNSRLAELVLDIWTLPVQALKGALGQAPAIELLRTTPGAVAQKGPGPVRASCAARLAAALLQHNDQSETVRLNNRPLPLQDLRGKSGAVALSFARQGIDHEDMAVIAKLLSSNVALTAVDFSGNPLSPAMADSIADILGSNKSLAAMNLSSVQLCGANSAEPDLSLLRVLCAALQTNHTLHAIGLGRNGLCWGEAAKANRDLTALRLLCDSLMENHGVVEVDLHGNSLGDDGVELAAALVSQRTRTRALDVRANEMTAHGAVVLAEALERNVHLRTLSGVPVYDMRNASLTELNLSGTEARQLHVGDAYLLAAALKENPGPITSIDLRGNNLADESMRLVGGALLGHTAGVCKVRFLKCENWSIDPELPKAQARLQRKKPGQFPVGLALDIKGQKLALGEATMLAGVLKQNRTLTFLRLMGTGMGLEAKAVLGNALLDNQNSKITHIECDGFQVHRKSTWMDLEQKELQPEDVVLLCGVLSSNNLVSMLNLNGNNVGVVGAKALTKALRSNSAVTDLHIDRCMLGEAGALQLQHLFKPHTAKDLSHAEQMLVRMRSREQQSVQKRAAAEKERAAVKIQENAVVAIRVAAEQLISDSKAEKLQLAPIYEEATAYAARLQQEEDEQTALLIRNQLMRERVTHESKAEECMTRITELNGITANTREAMKQHRANERHATKAREASDDVVTKAKKTLQDVEAERKRFEVKVTDFTAIARAEEAAMNLTSLSMVGNEFGERGLRSLGNAILCRCASKLHYLIMDGWSIVPDTLELNLSGMDVGVTDTMLIAGILKANRIVTSLNLQGSHMNDACKEAIGQAIMRNAHSKIESMACDAWSMADELVVDLSKLALNSADVVLLAAAVKHNTRLTTLLMPDDYVGDDAGGLALVDALRVNRTVTRLGDMRPDEMSEADFSDHAYTLLRVFEKQFFVRRLEFCTCLSSLILAHNDMGASEMIPLSEALKLNSSVTHLDISGNDLRDYGAKLFADVLRVSPSIGTLVMKDINVGVEGREALGRSLLDTDTSPMRGLVCDQWSVLHDLESLDLSNEGLTASHVYLLGAVLSRSCSVKEVVLAHNDLCPKVEMDDRVAGGHRFDTSGFGLFCEGLAKNKSVTKLDLCKTHLPTSAIRQLGVALCVNSTLQDVDLRFNFITEDGSRILGEALQVNASINVLGVGKCIVPVDKLRGAGDDHNLALNMRRSHLHVGGVCVVAGMIARSKNVTSLDLSGNNMHPEGTSAVALALQTNRSLHTLVLRDNTLGVDQLNNTEMSGIKAFAKSIGHHPTVTALDLHGNYLRGKLRPLARDPQALPFLAISC
jgi:Ran GTPase-activating protein (RanGAP) involved in mRNA processing and transport